MPTSQTERDPRRVERRYYQHLGLWKELGVRYSTKLIEMGRAGKIRATHHVAIPAEQLWIFHDLMTAQRSARFGRSRDAYSRATAAFKRFLSRFDEATYHPATGLTVVVPALESHEVQVEERGVVQKINAVFPGRSGRFPRVRRCRVR